MMRGSGATVASTREATWPKRARPAAVAGAPLVRGREEGERPATARWARVAWAG
jgi:hypothetical protein